MMPIHYKKDDDATINILVDFYLNHPDKLEETNLKDPNYKNSVPPNSIYTF